MEIDHKQLCPCVATDEKAFGTGGKASVHLQEDVEGRAWVLEDPCRKLSDS